MVTLTTFKLFILLIIVILLSTIMGTLIGGSLLMYYYRYKKGMRFITSLLDIDEAENMNEDMNENKQYDEDK